MHMLEHTRMHVLAIPHMCKGHNAQLQFATDHKVEIDHEERWQHPSIPRVVRFPNPLPRASESENLTIPREASPMSHVQASNIEANSFWPTKVFAVLREND